MNSGNFDCIYIYFGILLTILVSGCASLPNQKIGVFDNRQIEYSLIRNIDGPGIVVFENGLNEEMNEWNKIIPEISRYATTFAYNRPGYGSSESAPTPRDGLHVIDELRLLLRSNVLEPPYVLVGHSLGGLYMQLFARRYPEEVAGLIIVDSTHPNQFKDKGSVENWPPWLSIAFRWYLSPTARAEFDLINATGDEVLSFPPFTGKPVIVLSALRPMKEKSAIADDANEKRKDIARLYPGSKQVWVDSGHGIPDEKPESVIEAILEVLHTEGNKRAVMNVEGMEGRKPLPQATLWTSNDRLLAACKTSKTN